MKQIYAICAITIVLFFTCCYSPKKAKSDQDNSLFADISATDIERYVAIFESLNLTEADYNIWNFISPERKRALVEIDAYTSQYHNKKDSDATATPPIAEAVLWRLNQAEPILIAPNSSEVDRYNSICKLNECTSMDFEGTQREMNRLASSELLINEYIIMYYQNRILALNIDKNIKKALEKEFKTEEIYLDQLVDFYLNAIKGGEWYSMLPMELSFYLKNFASTYADALTQLYFSYTVNNYKFKLANGAQVTNSITTAYQNFKFGECYNECTLDDQKRALNENRSCWNNFITNRKIVTNLLSGKHKIIYKNGTRLLERDQKDRLKNNFVFISQ